jgi:hypothetical protein
MNLLMGNSNFFEPTRATKFFGSFFSSHSPFYPLLARIPLPGYL